MILWPTVEMEETVSMSYPHYPTEFIFAPAMKSTSVDRYHIYSASVLHRLSQNHSLCSDVFLNLTIDGTDSACILLTIQFYTDIIVTHTSFDSRISQTSLNIFPWDFVVEGRSEKPNEVNVEVKLQCVLSGVWSRFGLSSQLLLNKNKQFTIYTQQCPDPALLALPSQHLLLSESASYQPVQPESLASRKSVGPRDSP